MGLPTANINKMNKGGALGGSTALHWVNPSHLMITQLSHLLSLLTPLLFFDQSGRDFWQC